MVSEEINLIMGIPKNAHDSSIRQVSHLMTTYASQIVKTLSRLAAQSKELAITTIGPMGFAPPNDSAKQETKYPQVRELDSKNNIEANKTLETFKYVSPVQLFGAGWALNAGREGELPRIPGRTS